MYPLAGRRNPTLGTRSCRARSRPIGLFRSPSFADDARRLHIAEFTLARPGLAIRVAQFYSSELPFIHQTHIGPHLDVPELRYGAFGQSKMRRRTAICTKPDFCGRVVFI